jgi:putative redox protein
MVSITSTYNGNLRVTSVHGPSGTTLSTDAPKDNEGLAQSFSPTDLVPTALGSCMLTVMGIVARRREWAMEGARVEVEKHMVSEPVRRIGKLIARIHMPAALSEEARKILERTAHTCPVHQSLHPDIILDISFHYDL